MRTNDPDRRPPPIVAPPAKDTESPFELGELEEIDPPILPWQKREPVDRRNAESPFELGELEEIDPPLLPWRKRKPVERRNAARRADADEAG